MTLFIVLLLAVFFGALGFLLAIVLLGDAADPAEQLEELRDIVLADIAAMENTRRLQQAFYEARQGGGQW